MFYSPEKNVIVYDTPDALAIARACPDAHRLHNGYVAAPASLPNLQALTKAGMPTIAPLDLHYDWPGLFKPFHAQRLTANFLALNPRAFVLSDMGTGKTLAALWAADYIMAQHPPGSCRALIVSPLSTLRRVWSDEIFQHFMGRRRCVVLHGTAQQREKQLAQDADFYIINHDGVGVGATTTRYKSMALRGFAAALEKRSDIKMVIIDEASAYRDPGTGRHKVARHLLAGKDYLWLMTGTPTPNGPLDAYGMAKLVNNAYGESLTSYKQRVMQQITQFKWVPRPGAMDEAKKLLSPSVRFSIEDCVDLPPCVTMRMEAELSSEQKQHYKKMKDELALTLKSGAQITAANEGVLRSKLIQISCIAEGTRVLTHFGWEAIEDVTLAHRLWDGFEWVGHKGLVRKGVRETIMCDGVRLTPEHEVLTVSGWKPAGAIQGAYADGEFDRVEVWLPHGYRQGREHWWGRSLRYLAMRMRMREEGSSQEPIPSRRVSRASAELRVPSRERNSQNVVVAALQNLDTYAKALCGPLGQRLEKLRRKGHSSMRGMGKFLRKFLGRYERGLLPKADLRSERQQRKLLQKQLSVGHSETTAIKPETERRVVYDITYSGPRSRFVVRGEDGQLLIVHNCGAIYDAHHETHLIDAKPRMDVLREALAECNEKAIIFAPLTSVLHLLYKELSKDHACAIVNGAVSQKDRSEIFRAFTQDANPRILIADPQTMAHGLTLTAATTVVWYGPTDKTELYLQANKRIHRPGQSKTTRVIQIASTAVEREIYKRLENNETMQGVVLKLAEEK